MTDESAAGAPIKVAIACQGGGTHAAFAYGVLVELLDQLASADAPQVEIVALTGTSAGALNALMVWYGLAPKGGAEAPPSYKAARDQLVHFWETFTATELAEIAHNTLTQSLLAQHEREAPIFGMTLPTATLNPHGLFDDLVIWQYRQFGARAAYFDFTTLLAECCPAFTAIDWAKTTTRLLVGASEIRDGVETVFDSACNPASALAAATRERTTAASPWRARLPLSLAGVAASGTLPWVKVAEEIDGKHYWDGLYSQNPPIRELVAGVDLAHTPDEIWVVRINPQQTRDLPRTVAEIRDRENELMGNLSLNKELDFIVTVNNWLKRFATKADGDKARAFAEKYKPVTIRTLKMSQATAAGLRTVSKYDRSRQFIERLRDEGAAVAKDWLARWPEVGTYPHDAGYD